MNQKSLERARKRSSTRNKNGTGKAALHEILKKFPEIALDSTTRARDFREGRGAEFAKAGRYFWFFVVVQVVDMADFEKIQYMEAVALPYVVDNRVEMEQCAKRLANPSEPSG